MSAMGFPPLYISWIKECLPTPSYYVKINGTFEGFFEDMKAIRKEDALSPYFFMICMEILSKMLDKAFSERKISYHPLCNKIGLTHLYVANDRIIFSEAIALSSIGFNAVLSEFYLLSGLQVNFHKSEIFFCNVSPENQTALADLLGLKLCHLPVGYLGVPLISGK